MARQLWTATKRKGDVMRMKWKVYIGAIHFLSMYWLIYWWLCTPIDRSATPEQKQLLTAAWEYHGNYPATVMSDSIWLESPKGRIWIMRMGKKINH